MVDSELKHDLATTQFEETVRDEDGIDPALTTDLARQGEGGPGPSAQETQRKRKKLARHC